MVKLIMMSSTFLWSLAVILTFFEITNRSYVHGRPSPKVTYNNPSQSASLGSEMSSTGSIPVLTPNESLDVVEKVLHGELQPVLKTPDIIDLVPDFTEVPTPSERQNTDSIDSRQYSLDDIEPFIESIRITDIPASLDIAPHQIPIPPTPDISHQVDLSEYSDTSYHESRLPASIPYRVPLEEQVMPAETMDYKARSDNNHLITEDLPLQSEQIQSVESTDLSSDDVINRSVSENSHKQTTQDKEDFPTISFSGAVNNKSVSSETILPNVLTDREDLDTENISTKSTDKIEDFSIHEDFSERLSHNDQDFPQMIDTGIKDNTLVTPGILLREISDDEKTKSQMLEKIQPYRSDFSLNEDSLLQSEPNLQDVPVNVSTGMVSNMQSSLPTVTDRPVLDEHSITPRTSDGVHPLDKNPAVSENLPEITIQSVKDLPVSPGNALESGKSISAESIAPALNERFIKVVQHMPVLQTQIKLNNVDTPSVFSHVKLQSNQNMNSTPETPNGNFKNYEHPKNNGLQEYYDENPETKKQPLKASHTEIMKIVPKESKTAYLPSDQIVGSPHPKRPFDHLAKTVASENSFIANKPTFSKRTFPSIRNVEADLLGVDDVFDSVSDSKSTYSSSEQVDSEEDFEFWKKMKRFVDYEAAHDFPNAEYNLATNSVPVGIPLVNYTTTVVDTKPNGTQDIHVMKIPKRLETDQAGPAEEENAVERNLTTGSVKNLKNIELVPVEQEYLTLPFDNATGTLNTEATTLGTDLPVNEEYRIGEDEYSVYDLTTESPVFNTFSTLQPENYEDKRIFTDVTNNFRTDKTIEEPVQDTTGLEKAENLNGNFYQLMKPSKNQNFRSDSKERLTRNDVLSSDQGSLQGSVGGSDNVSKLEDYSVLPHMDLRFSKSETENFTTDEPLFVDDDLPHELPINSTVPLLEQEKDEYLEPTDLNVIESENPILPSNNVDHSVSKKDDPLKTVDDLPIPAGFGGVEKASVKYDSVDRNQNSVLTAHDHFSPPSHIGANPDLPYLQGSKRIRRSSTSEMGRLEEPRHNDSIGSDLVVLSPKLLHFVSSSASPTISSTPRYLIATSPTSPFPINISIPKQFSSTTPVDSTPPTTVTTPAPSTSLTSPASNTLITLAPSTTGMTPAFSTTPISPAPLTTLMTQVNPTTIMPRLASSATLVTPVSSSRTTSPPLATPTTSAAPTTFEILPTPLPETSTIAILPTSTPALTPIPPKKKKKMVWKIPFYPNNIAITSSGQVRLEPKDKSAKVPIATTPKPFLRDRLKQEDIERARERLLKRFLFRRPTSVPTPDTAIIERHQPSVITSTTPDLTAQLPVRPKVNEDVLAFVTAQNPSEMPTLLYNSPEEREEARRRRLRTMVGLAGDVRSLLSDRAKHAVHTVGNIVGGGGENKKSQ